MRTRVDPAVFGAVLAALLRHTGPADFARALIPRQRVMFTAQHSGHAVYPHAAHVPEHPLPLHGPYLADQALHHGCLAVTAVILAGKR